MRPMRIPASSSARTFRNPIGRGGDPTVFTAGRSYYLTLTDDGDLGHVNMWKAASLGKLASARKRTVFTPPAPDNKEIWRPRVYRVGGKWYLLYTATDRAGAPHRLHIAVAGAPDGPYRHLALLRPGGHRGNEIDPVLMFHNGRTYLAFVGAVPDTANGLFLAPLSRLTKVGKAVRIPASGGTDGRCPKIREAPGFLYRNGRTWMVYSACNARTPDYRLMVESVAAKTNPLVTRNWRQVKAPVFQRRDAARVFGPGSASFFRSPDGRQDWIVYHAKDFSGDAFVPRTVRTQRFGWAKDGSPAFGVPVALGQSLALPSGDPGR